MRHTQIVQAIIPIDYGKTTLGPPRSVHQIPVSNVLSDLLITLWRNYSNKSLLSSQMALSREIPSGKHTRILSRGCCCCYFVFIVVVVVVFNKTGKETSLPMKNSSFSVAPIFMLSYFTF